MTGANVGAGVAGTHRPSDMTGLDKSVGSGVLPTYAPNPVSADVTGKIVAGLMMNKTANPPGAGKPPGSSKGEGALEKFPVAEREPEPPRDIPATWPIRGVQEINKVQQSDFDTDSQEEGAFYLPFQEEQEKEEEEKLEAEEIKDNIVVDEALTWTGHISEYHYSPEKLHTNSIALVSSMLPFRVPISRH